MQTAVRLWVRKRITDPNLAHLRKQIEPLVPEGSNVVDIGCASGCLLRTLAPKIGHGVGIDMDKKLIEYACKKAEKEGRGNLKFIAEDALGVSGKLGFDPGVVVIALCLHEMKTDTALSILREFSSIAQQLIIVDFVEPDSWLYKKLLHLDEFLAGHLDRYKAYRDNGGMDALLDEAGLHVQDVQDTQLPMIKLWVVTHVAKPMHA